MDSASVDAAIRTLASNQHGVMTFAQCREAGIEVLQLRHRLERGMLERLSSVVYRLVGAPATPFAGAMAAVVDVGEDAALSHESAAAAWGLPGFDLEPHHVIGVRHRVRVGSSPLALIHEPRLLLEHHVTALDGVRIVTPTRLMFDLAGARNVHPLRLERALDTALSRRLVSIGSLDRVLDDLARRGRRGISLMRELIDVRRHVRPTESALETRFEELARRAGLTGFERQVDRGSDDAWIGRVDFIDRERGLIVETDTALHHGSVSDRRHDETRRRHLRAQGLLVLVFTDVDVFHRPDDVVAQLRASKRHLDRPAV